MPDSGATAAGENRSRARCSYPSPSFVCSACLWLERHRPIPRSSASTSTHNPAQTPSALPNRLKQLKKDLVIALAGKEKLVTIVDAKDKADVVVEVHERATTVPLIVIGLPAARAGHQPRSNRADARSAVAYQRVTYSSPTSPCNIMKRTA